MYRKSSFAWKPATLDYSGIHYNNITIHFVILVWLSLHPGCAYSVTFELNSRFNRLQKTITNSSCLRKKVAVSILSRINISFVLMFTIAIFVTNIVTWLFIFLQQCGDIHPNPGQNTSLIDTSNQSLRSCDWSSHVSLVHYNVQSILAKMDLIQAELSHFDILSFSETWLSPNICNKDLELQHYQSPERKDRNNDSHGGVLLYVRDNLSYKRRNDLEINGTECIWIELTLRYSVKLLIGLFYRPPNSNALTDDYRKFH